MARLISTTDRRPAQASRLRGRRGYTLVESMIASALLAITVTGVSGTILASYEHDLQSKQQHDALRNAEALKDELTALPMEAPTTSDVGLMDFANYNDSVEGGELVIATAAKQAQKEQAAGTGGTSTGGSGLLGGLLGGVAGVVGGLIGGTDGETTLSGTPTGGGTAVNGGSLATSAGTATRSAQVVRKSTLNGSAVAAGELAIVTIDVAVGPSQKVRVKRLVSTTEAAANGGAVP